MGTISNNNCDEELLIQAKRDALESGDQIELEKIVTDATGEYKYFVFYVNGLDDVVLVYALPKRAKKFEFKFYR